MARLPIASVAVAVLLIGACITLGYLALLHADGLESAATASKAVPVRPTVLQRMKRQLSGKPDPCVGLSDSHTDCTAWAQEGECSKNPGYMMESCQRACNSTCLKPAASSAVSVKAAASSVLSRWSASKDFCEDKSSYCGQWAAVGECDSNPHYMRTQCRVTCGLCQSDGCHDVNVTRCKAEAAEGLCRSEPERMYRECRWACSWCAMTTSKTCLRAQDQQPAAWAGSVESMFARAADAGVHGRFAPRVLSRSPWVVAFDNFLSDAECDRVIEIAGRHFARSVAGDGVQAVRTSSTAWCSPGACQSDPTMAAIRARIANLTTVPANNAEHMQVLRYEPGQFYKVHHDQNSPQTSAWGPRLYTFFMYLNDVEAGGQTHFPRLNISVAPRRGAALLWPSVLDHDPNLRDDRTEHESVAVGRGTKYAANYWLHMWDFQEPTRHGCGNTEVFGNW